MGSNQIATLVINNNEESGGSKSDGEGLAGGNLGCFPFKQALQFAILEIFQVIRNTFFQSVEEL